LEYDILKKEALQRLALMNKKNLCQACGFLKCLIILRGTGRQIYNNRRPLIAVKKNVE
jgi:hypothetical protein